MADRHQLLRRQLRRVLKTEVEPPELRALLDLVDQAYRQADSDRLLNERALELTSQELVARADKLRAFFDSAPSPMGIVEIVSGELVLVSHNAASIRALGAPASGRARLSTIGWSEAQERIWIEECRRSRTAGHPIQFDCELTAGPETRWLSANVCWIDRWRDVEAFAFVIEDLTERRALFDRLARQETLAALGTLAAGVAHEMNNPLTYVLGNLELAIAELRELEPPATASPRLQAVIGALDDAREGAERLRRIVLDLRVRSHPGSFELGPVDLEAVLSFACAVAAAEIRDRTQLRCRCLQPVPRVIGEETRLGQVFVNLLTNAAQSIEPGRPQENLVAIEYGLTEDGRPFVDVSDTGCGIAPDRLDRIFEPFFTTKPKGVGTGLGLSICKEILHAAGADITVLRSVVGRGTTFRVTLRASSEVEAGRPPSNRVPSRIRVLAVDDDPLVLGALRRALGVGYDVTGAAEGTEALALVRREDPFDVVLSDLRMPGMDGLELYSRIAALHPDLAARFVLVTGEPLESIVGLPASVRVLPKPFDRNELRDVVAEHAARR